jgi:EpsI family protein
MSSRRDLLIGAACLAGAGAAYSLVPRRHVPLLKPGRRLEQIVPAAFGGWTSRSVTDLVAPKEEGSLAAKLYGQTVGRIYSRPQEGVEIMMLLAYGDTQSDDLQLHRPEICYPAFGFAISQSAVLQLPLPGGGLLPVRRLVADAPDRRETIIYWSRLGEFLPLNRKQQQLDRLRTAMKGNIADGLLARFSVAGADPDAAVAALQSFIPPLVEAVAADSRKVLIGTQLAEGMAGVKV